MEWRLIFDNISSRLLRNGRMKRNRGTNPPIESYEVLGERLCDLRSRILWEYDAIYLEIEHLCGDLISETERGENFEYKIHFHF